MGLFKFFIGFSETESTNFSSARAGPFKIAKPYWTSLVRHLKPSLILKLT